VNVVEEEKTRGRERKNLVGDMGPKPLIRCYPFQRDKDTHILYRGTMLLFV